MSYNKRKFPYKWYLADGFPAKGIEKHGKKVFGTFISGGGSTMGYKLAGYSHLGGVEIDKDVANVYKKNFNPKHFFLEDLREFNQRNDIPNELLELDLLDGSPPCSTFSMAGSREKAWGKKKKFREGQVAQTLDDLVFVYCNTILKLKPKTFILENVKGLITGNAKAYAKRIVKTLQNGGYNVQVFLLNAASMGVPQMRERVFIIGGRKDLNLSKLNLNFNEKPILFREIEGAPGKPLSKKDWHIWKKRKYGDSNFSDTLVRIGQKESNWNSKYIYPGRVCNTIASSMASKLIELAHSQWITISRGMISNISLE